MNEEKVINSIAHNSITEEKKKVGKIRTVAYCRVSTIQEEQELSFESQCEYFEKLIKSDKNREFLGIYSDHGISGLSAEKRPGFLKMMEDADAGKFDFIYAKAISRFSRNAAECLACIRELNRKGITVYFERESIYSSNPQFEMILTLLASTAQEESRSISENIRWSIDHNCANGTPTRPCCYGYRKKAGNKKVWEIVPEEATIVQKVFELAAGGIKPAQIAKTINKTISFSEDGNQSKRWTATRVKYVLKNEAYVGDIVTSKRWKPDYLSKKAIRNKGEHEQFYLEDHHEAIVSRELFNKVNHRSVSA